MVKFTTSLALVLLLAVLVAVALPAASCFLAVQPDPLDNPEEAQLRAAYMDLQECEIRARDAGNAGEAERLRGEAHEALLRLNAHVAAGR